MRKLTSFNFITLNGFYKTLDGNIDWHRHGKEEGDFSADSLQAGNVLVFGRITYEMMAGWWPSPAAMEYDPVVAEGMNKAEKIVFSRTMKKAQWNNSRLIQNDIVEEMKKLKQLPGKDMTILGSGSIVSQFADAHLIDQYQLMIDPVALGDGVPIFNGMKNKLALQLTSTRTFKSGTVLLTYSPLD